MGLGEASADRYMTDLYDAMSKVAGNPDAGVLLRKHHAAPFLMVSVRQHFLVYDRIPQGVAILTVLHQVRDIDSLIAILAPAFLQEVDQLKAAQSKGTPKSRGKKKCD